MQLKQDLGLALAENQFQLYLQGQFDIDANAIDAEVLLRWQHPEFGMVMPNDFIPLTEETGLINPIGYSSLSILKNLALNELKIDKNFVQDITTNSVIESSIVQTILQMSKNLKLRVVAEGVETEQQLAYLRNYGCSVFQGYFFEKPCAVHAFEKNIAKKITAQKAILALHKTVLQKVRKSNEIRH